VYITGREGGARGPGAEGPLAPPVYKVAAPALLHQHMHRTFQLNGPKQQVAEPLAVSYLAILYRQSIQGKCMQRIIMLIIVVVITALAEVRQKKVKN
jgi:hypothetical protein